ncbi:MAG TPA: four helix bundle protein [Blastocatellia bacterium]|nr:four helix bundle protein [Blastocatellia bacterium]
MADSIIKDKSYKFAIRIVRLCKALNEKKEYVLSREVLRAGTYVGARVKEAQQAESRHDFIHKMSVALQNASEAEYWLELLRDTDFIDQKAFDSLNDDCAEILRLLTKIVKSSKQNN